MVQKTPRARGRPRGYEPDSALAQVLDRFWIGGFAATSLDDLSDATGMNRPSLYAAFGDKRALYLKAMAAYRASGQAAFGPLLGEKRPLRETLTRFYEAAIDIYRGGEPDARGCFMTGTALTEAVRDAEIRAALSEVLHELDAVFETLFAAGLADGTAPAGLDPRGAAALASAVIHTLAVRSRAGASRDELTRIAGQAIDILLGPSEAATSKAGRRRKAATGG